MFHRVDENQSYILESVPSRIENCPFFDSTEVTASTAKPKDSCSSSNNFMVLFNKI